MKRFLPILVLALMACSQTPANTVCATDASADQPAPKHWKKYRVKAEVAGSGEYLLGINGERVLAGAALPELVLKEGRAILEEVWPNRVDWAVYQHTARADEAVVSVYFDSDKTGRQHLCRIESEDRALRFPVADGGDEPAESQPVLGKLAIVEVEQFRYDAESRLLAIERKILDDEGKGLQARPASCFQYTLAGNVQSLAEVAGGDCRQATPADSHTRFVYGSDERLIRKIFSEAQLELVDNQYQKVPHPVVQVFDVAGKLLAEYRETAERTPYRKKIVPATASSNIRDTWVMDDPPRNFIFTDNGHRDWAIVAVPANEETSYYGIELPEMTKLAKGKTDKRGLVNIGKSAPAIRKALHQPDTVVAFYSEGQVFILTPAVSAEDWQKCQSSEAATRDACP